MDSDSLATQMGLFHSAVNLEGVNTLTWEFIAFRFFGRFKESTVTKGKESW